MVLPWPGSRFPRVCPVFTPPGASKATPGWHPAVTGRGGHLRGALTSYAHDPVIFPFCCACDHFQRKALQGFGGDRCPSFPLPRSRQIFQTEGTHGALAQAPLLGRTRCKDVSEEEQTEEERVAEMDCSGVSVVSDCGETHLRSCRRPSWTSWQWAGA